MTKVFSNSRLFIRYMKEELFMLVEKVAQGEFPKGRGVSGTTNPSLDDDDDNLSLIKLVSPFSVIRPKDVPPIRWELK